MSQMTHGLQGLPVEALRSVAVLGKQAEKHAREDKQELKIRVKRKQKKKGSQLRNESDHSMASL